MEMQRAAADTHAVFFVNGKSEVQTPNNHTQAGDQNFHNKLPPQWLKSLQALLWAFQSSFHRSLNPLWDYKTDNFFGCNGTPNTLMLRGSIGASYLHPLQCILLAEEFGAARSSKDFALAIKTISAKWSFLVFNLHLPHGDEYGCTKKKFIKFPLKCLAWESARISRWKTFAGNVSILPSHFVRAVPHLAAGLMGSHSSRADRPSLYL